MSFTPEEIASTIARTPPVMKTGMAWYEGATKARKDSLAAKARTSVDALWQMLTGRRPASARKAAEIEAAAKMLGEPLRRGDVCATCAACPYYEEITAKELLL